MRLLAIFCCICFLQIPVSALEIEAPTIPAEHLDQMPDETDSLWAGLWNIAQKAVDAVIPDIHGASEIAISIIASVILISIIQTVSSPLQKSTEMAGITVITWILLSNTNAMIGLAADTIQEISDYGKLLLPVMTTALAAQGGITTSGVIYAGTAFFTSLLQSIMTGVMIPGIYLYVGLGLGNAATGEELLKRTGDLLKGLIGWCLKILLMIFTTYLSLSRAISGTTDAAALKAAKVSLSTFVPVVGSVLSDASETVLVSAGVLKNAAGIYGILAVFALFLHPFLQIGIHYLILKITGAICGILGPVRMSGMVDCFTSALGFLLGITGASCVMILISTVCFMKGVG